MVKSKRTLHCQTMKFIFGLLHFLCLFGPLIFFIPYGFITGEPVEKIGMSFTIIISAILAIISLVVSVTAKAGLHKSMMWTLMAGVLFCLQEIKVFIWIMCITSIMDELIFCKLKDYYKTTYMTNLEIDRRA